MFYIDQLHTPSFPIGLVKTESSFIARSVETGLGRWTLVAAAISVDAYPFGFLRSDLSLWGYGNKSILVALCCLIARRPNLEVAIKRLFHQRIFLRSLGVICYDRWVLRVAKITSRIGVSWTNNLPFYI